MQYNKNMPEDSMRIRLAQIASDMDQTAYLYRLFKNKDARIAINKLRYLLIITKHNLSEGEDWE